MKFNYCIHKQLLRQLVYSESRVGKKDTGNYHHGLYMWLVVALEIVDLLRSIYRSSPEIISISDHFCPVSPARSVE